jgi:hypothetical protein
MHSATAPLAGLTWLQNCSASALQFRPTFAALTMATWHSTESSLKWNFMHSLSGLPPDLITPAQKALTSLAQVVATDADSAADVTMNSESATVAAPRPK